MSYVDSLFNADGKTAVVTGAARGNGKSMAEALLKAGAVVYCVDVLEKELQETVCSFQSEALDARMVVADLTDKRSIQSIVDTVIAQSQKIDILVNNAGITKGSPVLDYPEEDWDLTYEVNLKAHFLLSQAVARVMKENGGGSIINITSLNAEMAFPDNPSYVACKGALKMLSKSLALDLGKYNIRVNNIGPGYFRTNMTAKSWANPEMRADRTSHTVLGRWGDPEKDLAGAVIFLASDASSYITGQDIYIDGGWLIKGL